MLNRFGYRALLVEKRTYATSLSYERICANARENTYTLLEKQDRSSYILSQYIPEPARDAFIAIRAFNIEVNKINDGGTSTGTVASQASNQLRSTMGVSTADMKFMFWSDLVSKIFADPYSEKDIGEPTAILLRDALQKDLNLDISYFHKFLQTRKHFLENKTFDNTDTICSYGEGTYSQLNYLTQGLLLSPSISPSSITLLESSLVLQNLVSDISAHIGQATAIGSMILGMEYYASTRNQVTLPVDLMTKYDLSQEALLSASQGHAEDDKAIEDIRSKLKNIIFDTATTANDHMLTARSKLEKSRSEIRDILRRHSDNNYLQRHSKRWRNGIPDALFTPFMISIPTSLYLDKLQKYDFDVFNPKLRQKEWRLAWRSFKDYYTRKI